MGKVQVLKGTSGTSEKIKAFDGDKYRNGWDKAFGKKNEKKDKVAVKKSK
jgi:hypothetical protein